MLPTLTLLSQTVQQPEVSSISLQHRVVRNSLIMCYMVEIHAYMQCLNYCLVYGYIYCLHYVAFIHRILNNEFERKEDDLTWWYELEIYDDTMFKVYVSMAYVCHRNDFEMYFNVFKKDVMPPSTTGGYYGRFNIEPYYGDCCWELSRGNWGPCKPHLTTMLRARHVHKNGVPRYMDIYF